MQHVKRENFKMLKTIIPEIESLKGGGNAVLSAKSYQNLEFEVMRGDSEQPIGTLCRWFEHPSGDTFADGGMEMKIDFLKGELQAVSMREPTYLEEGVTLPNYEERQLDGILFGWLKTLNERGYKSSSPTSSLSK